MGYSMRKAGFTIVELMIAISVFATAMTLVLSGVLVISRQYQQASNRVALEEASRSIHQQFGESIRYAGTNVSTATPPGDWAYTCIGKETYIYAKSLLAYSSKPKGLFVKSNGVCDADYSVATNLLPDGAVVTNFTIIPSGNSYTISTQFVKADQDLLLFPSNDDTKPADGCNLQVFGREFCSVVNLNSTIVKRVN